tara:strand:- start:3388 stop:4206 length:819 start_codon:yes stop_codon:yes gene_type:complete
MDVQNASKDFLESNNLITKFVFIIGLLIVFLILLRFFISIGAWMFMASPTPHFTDGINSTDEGYIINVNPTKFGSKPVLRSVNEKEGLEFTYSIWLYIKDLNDSGDNECIFRKGATALNRDETNGPGLYIKKENNEAHLTVKMDYYNSNPLSNDAYDTEEIVDVKVPLRTWANVMIRCNGQNLDVLINGILYSSKLLPGIPRQNYYDIEFSGGSAGKEPFEGYISDFWYWNYSLGTNAIVNLINNGPNTKNLKQKQSMDDKVPEYLSFNWFI